MTPSADPEFELIRRQFRAEMVTWLPSWYRAHALQMAVGNRARSEALGDEGLRRFKADVEGLCAQAPQIVDFHLSEDVWWEHDQAMDTLTIIYAVRLCMGTLALPLQHAGYIRPNEWREVTRHHHRTRHEQDEHGAFLHPEEMILVPVPSRRFFFSLGQADAATYDTEDWSPGMKDLIGRYHIRVLRANRAITAQAEQQRADGRTESEARIKSVLGFVVFG